MIKAMRNEGNTIIFVGVNDKYLGFVALKDSPRNGARITVLNLLSQGNVEWSELHYIDCNILT